MRPRLSLLGIALASCGLLHGCGSVAQAPVAPPKSPTLEPGARPSESTPSLSDKRLRPSPPSVSAAKAASDYAAHASFLGSGMSGPNGLAIASDDTLYEADYFRGTVTQVKQSGAVRTYTSGVTTPAGLAFDPSGNLLIAAYEGKQIDRVRPGGGAFSVFATGFNHPVWPAVDSKGTIYAADYDNNRIAKVAPDGSVTTFVSLPNPNAIAFDRNDTLYVTNWAGTVYRVTPAGETSTVASGLYSADGIAWSPNYLAVVLYGGEHSSDGKLILVDFDGTTYAVASGLDRASSVIFDSQESVYTADCGDTALRKYALR